MSRKEILQNYISLFEQWPTTIQFNTKILIRTADWMYDISQNEHTFVLSVMILNRFLNVRIVSINNLQGYAHAVVHVVSCLNRKRLSVERLAYLSGGLFTDDDIIKFHGEIVEALNAKLFIPTAIDIAKLLDIDMNNLICLLYHNPKV